MVCESILIPIPISITISISIPIPIPIPSPIPIGPLDWVSAFGPVWPHIRRAALRRLTCAGRPIRMEGCPVVGVIQSDTRE